MFAFPFSNACMSGLLGDPESEQLFDSAAVLQRMLKFEAALARALHAESEISEVAFNAIEHGIRDFEPDVAKMAAAAERDGVVVPELVAQFRETLPPSFRAKFHMGATSQDVIDTALSMTLIEFNQVLEARLGEASRLLVRLRKEHGNTKIAARTRMQRAGTLPAANRISVWANAIDRLAAELAEAKARVEILQFAGPLGTRESMPIRNPDLVAKRLADELGLADVGVSWQSDRARLSTYASWLASVSGSLGKVGADIGLMAQNGEIEYSGGGKSSSLPDKNNPVGAEVLVSMARLGAVLVSGMHHASVHEQERSGAAWTLEWMVLPQLCLVTAAALKTMIGTAGAISGFRERTNLAPASE